MHSRLQLLHHAAGLHCSRLFGSFERVEIRLLKPQTHSNSALEHQTNFQLIAFHNLIFLRHQLRHIPRAVDITSTKPLSLLFRKINNGVRAQFWRFNKNYSKMSLYTSAYRRVSTYQASKHHSTPLVLQQYL